MTTSTITVTDAAATRIKHLMSEQGEDKLGLRVGVRDAGCSGMAYTLDFTEAANDGDQIIDDKGVTVVVDAEAAIFPGRRRDGLRRGEAPFGFSSSTIRMKPVAAAAANHSASDAAARGVMTGSHRFPYGASICRG